MTQFLPPNLLALFAPRDPIPFLPQLEKLPHEKHHNQPYSGIAPFIRHFEVSVAVTCEPPSPRCLCLTFLLFPTRILEMPPHQPEPRPARNAWRER